MSELPSVSTVKVTSYGIRVDRGLELHDPAVRTAATAALARGQAVDDWLVQMIRLGVAACEAAGTRRELDQLERSLQAVDQQVRATVEEAVGRLTEHVSQAVDPERNGLARISEDSMQRLNDGVARLVTGSDAVLATNLRTLVSNVFTDAQSSIAAILSSQAAATQRVLQEDRSSVRDALLSSAERHHGELRAALADIRERLLVAESVKRGRANSSHHGDDYEADCLRMLQDLAVTTGDAGGLAHTARTSGADGNMVGDITVELAGLTARAGSPGTLVIECKDRPKGKPTLPAVRAELRAARSNRKADLSIMLSPRAAMPVPETLVVVLEPNSLLVCWDPEDDPALVAAAWLLLKMLAASQAAGLKGDIDIERARKQLDSARAALQHIEDIVRNAGRAQRALVMLKESSEVLRTELLRRLQELAQTLNGGEPELTAEDATGSTEASGSADRAAPDAA